MNITRESFFAFFLNITLLLTVLFISVVTVRALGSEGRGIYVLVQSTALLISMLFNFGLPWATVYYTSRFPRSLGAITGNIIFQTFIVLVGAFFIVSMKNAFIEKILDIDRINNYRFPVVILAASFFLIQSFVSILQGEKEISKASAVNLLPYFIYLLLLIILFAGRLLNNRTMIWAFTAAQFFFAIIFLLMFVRKKGISIKLNFQFYRTSVLRIGLKAQFINILGLIQQRADLFILNAYHGLASTGFYSIAMYLGTATYQIPAVLGSILFPLSASRKDGPDTKDRTVRLMRFVLLLQILFYLFFLIAGRLIFSILYGGKYAACHGLLLALYPGIIFCSLSMLINSYYAGQAYPAVLIANTILAITINLSLNMLLVPAMAEYGAAVAFSISHFVLFLWPAVNLARSNNYSLKDMLGWKPSETKEYLLKILSFFYDFFEKPGNVA